MEQLLHYVWNYKLFPLRPIVTTHGEEVEIINVGLYNRNAGPDFFNAKVRIGDTVWVGNIEIHQYSSDWYRHGHNHDKAYDSVILHLAEEIDTPIYRTNGQEIPQAELHCPQGLTDEYTHLLHTIDSPACHKILPSLPKLKLHSWLSALTVERFEQKYTQICERLQRSDNDWEKAFFITLSRNFGFGINNDAFERWAGLIDLNAVRKHRNQLNQVEAIFLGRAGFLNVPTSDLYVANLKQEYAYLTHKFQWDEVPDLNWKLLRLRPGNFPHLRLAQLACLYHRAEHLFSQLMEADNINTLRNLLRGGASEYWNTHYLLGEVSENIPKTLSNSTIDLIIINTVIPFLYAYGKACHKETYSTRATELLETLKPENNYIIRIWNNYGIKAEHAADSQALIQLKKMYCDPKKCLYCRIGYEYFLKFVERNQ